MDRHPEIVFRDGPAGRRAGLWRGPDVWPVVALARSVPERGHQGAIDLWIERNDRGPGGRGDMAPRPGGAGLKLLLTGSSSRVIAEQLRSRGHDVAAVTDDVAHLAALHAAYTATGQRHPLPARPAGHARPGLTESFHRLLRDPPAHVVAAPGFVHWLD